ncbi:hypothetical protein [Vannielia litorea]|uniref:Uncharacterized protein n=1 Tax=Vannielia litorea TaxID=1217970 RepID=A0A1N6E7P9_9RHOB|nr:hypothetical protein [Vannielia litorea]SIN79023.1 hypothetical protein SAMN05444002_0429 [Vannielia litorea]
MRQIIATLCALVATPAAAACPVAADLEAGLRARLEATEVTLVISARDGTILRDAPGLPGGQMRMAYLHPLLVSETGPAAAPTRYAYAADPAPLDRLDELGRWQSGVTIAPAGAAVREGEVVVRYLGPSVAVAGACRYPAWEVSITVSVGWMAPLETRHIYAPDLGLVTASEVQGPMAALFPPMRLTEVARR